MSAPNLQNLVAEFGTEAVMLYQRMSGENADLMPEQFLGGFIAQKLHGALGCRAHVERKYTQMAKELGIWTSELEKQMRGWEADVAIYEAGSPSHLVELKKFGELQRVPDIVADRDKGWKLAASGPISVLLGILICQTSSSRLDSRIRELEHALGSQRILGQEHEPISGNWKWRFACWSTMKD